jgi:hypothetical protein
MNRDRAAALPFLIGVLSLLWPVTGAAKTKLTSEPAHLTTDGTRARSIIVSGAPRGEFDVAVNVGAVVDVDRDPRGRLRLRYRLPSKAFPRHLCFLLRRKGPAPRSYHVLRIPLFAPASVPIVTRPRAKVSLEIGARIVGPKRTDAKGKATIRAMVPPWLDEVWARVVDDKGLETRKKMRVKQPAYPHHAMLLDVLRRKGRGRPRLRVAVAAARAERPFQLELIAPDGGTRKLEARGGGQGIAVASWTPSSGEPEGSWRVRVIVANRVALTRSVELDKGPAGRVRGFFGRLRWSLGLGLGLTHNLGELVSPRFALGLGVDHRLGPGRLGISLRVGLAWDTQDTDLSAALGTASTRLLLLPVIIGAHYELPLGPVAPYALAGLLLGVAVTSSEGQATADATSTNIALGVAAMVGARLKLGPGGIFVEVGYHHSQLDTIDVEAQTGGLVAQAGYRLELGATD